MVDVAAIERKLADMGGFWIWQDILDAIANKDMVMFAVGESFAVVKEIAFPRRRLLDIVLVHGKKSDMSKLEEIVELHKEAVGASGLFASGRPGWVREMHSSWRVLSINYIKE